MTIGCKQSIDAIVDIIVNRSGVVLSGSVRSLTVVNAVGRQRHSREGAGSRKQIQR